MDVNFKGIIRKSSDTWKQIYSTKIASFSRGRQNILIFESHFTAVYKQVLDVIVTVGITTFYYDYYSLSNLFIYIFFIVSFNLQIYS